MLASVAVSREPRRFASFRGSGVEKYMAAKLRADIAAFESGESFSGGKAEAFGLVGSRTPRSPVFSA